MSQEPSFDRDEMRLKSMLRSIESSAAAPDLDALKALRNQSADLFAASTDQLANPPEQASTTDPASATNTASHTELPSSQNNHHPVVLSIPTLNEQPSRRRPMLTIAMRGAVVAAMSLVMMTTWFFPSGSKPASAALVPFSKILEGLNGASTLELQLIKQGVASQILVRAPGVVRKEQSPVRYEIASGSRLWRVDEEANTVEEEDSPWFRKPNAAVDLMALLDVGVSDSSPLLRARPVERAAFPTDLDKDLSLAAKSDSADQQKAIEAKKDCLVYRAALLTEHGRIEVEAFVHEKDQRLLGIFAWPAGVRRKAGPPLAEMRLLAMNLAVGDEKFEISKSLTEDGRIGKVTQAQGIVGLRPMLAKRWTPIACDTVIKPGDWIRTELRGANAVKVTLSSDVELTLGPGTLVECVSPTKARIHQGVIQVHWNPEPKTKDAANAPKTEGHEFTLLAPREGSRTFKSGDKQLLRVDPSEQLVNVPQTPVWLAGFEGTSNNESIGSLIVNLPDGRIEPLTVGYHKVLVEIRDQIARTTIEESFVNHTPGRLEGVFHFPLPQDASISGFGMWIGNDLVEADVVEKQRAREIYETILREKRDPGLLEWTSGNIFKARVFPIEAHSEKRIKIVYTQVLPMRGDKYRYAYGLRSEMLRTTPLRELSLKVTVNSQLGIKSITCPTHPVRAQQTAHSAQLEFTAQEYTPNRDLEVVCEIDHQQSDVVVIPHRRGDDGYFLVQITPPFDRERAGGKRLGDLIPDGNPLNIVLLCDTSASMDKEKRSQQSQFVASVLSSLGPDDRFQIVACDVGTAAASPAPVAPTPENFAVATKFLESRVSLGWTNLDRAFDDVLKRADAGSQIVYVGDGILSAGDIDPAAFVKRLGQQIQAASQADAKTGGKDRASTAGLAFHAVTVGNTNEQVVLKGIANVGGGSVRTIAGEQTPQVVAREFLNEIAQPGLREVNVEFKGVKVAAVYPGRLPNLPAGSQQILVGRYLPEPGGKSDQQGEVIVTGLRGSEKVKYAAKISLKDAEEGNEFIPRLWARAHLDHLLAQGQTSFIHDEIIRLSEEFHIITPFTSLLVLETDADRERFGVKRRFEMRDGERFFAEGRDNAHFELLQQQMKRAGDWRLNIRRNILQSLARLGRDPQALQQLTQQQDDYFRHFDGRARRPMSSASSTVYFANGPVGRASAPFGGGGGRGGMEFGMRGLYDSLDEMEVLGQSSSKLSVLGDLSKQDSEEFGMPFEPTALGLNGPSVFNESKRELGYDFDEGAQLEAARDQGRLKDSIRGERNRANKSMSEWDGIVDFNGQAMGFEPADRKWSDDAPIAGKPITLMGRMGGGFGGAYNGRYSYQQPDYTSWINSIFPSEPIYLPRPVTFKDPQTWTPEAIALANSLLRTETLTKLDGGLELRQVTDSFDPRWNRQTYRSTSLTLYSPTGWMTRGIQPQQQTLIQYCDGKDRGVYSLSFLLGRVRTTRPRDLTTIPFSLSDFSLNPLQQSYAAYTARVEPAGDNQVNLILTIPRAESEVRITIDTARHVIVRLVNLSEGKASSALTFSDFVQIAGSWWATTVVSTDAKEQVTNDTRLELKEFDKNQYTDRLTVELSDKAKVQFLRYPYPTLDVARQKVADGSANFNDRMVMVLHNAQLQQWDEMWKHLDAAEKVAADKPGVRWIRPILLETVRRNEESQQLWTAEARRLTQGVTQDEVYLAEFVLGHLRSLVSMPDFHKAHQSLKPIYDRPFAERLPVAPKSKLGREAADERAAAELQRSITMMWTDREIASLELLDRYDEGLALHRTTALNSPWDVYRALNHSQKLIFRGRYAEAHAWLRSALQRPELNKEEIDSLREGVANLYRQQGEWAELLKWTTEWISLKSDSTSHTSPYSQHFAALIYNDQLDAAYALAEQWLREARVEGKMTGIQRARLEACLNFANGSVYGLYLNRTDRRWFQPLAETARFFLRKPIYMDIVQRVASNHNLMQSETGDQLRGEWLTALRTESPKFEVGQLQSLVDWTLGGRMELPEPLNGRKQLDAGEIPNEIWKSISDEMKARWAAATDKNEKYSFSEIVRKIYASRFNDSLLLPFLRERIVNAHVDYRYTYVSSLFDTLLTTAWTAEIEQEALDVLRTLSDKTDPSDKLAIELPALMRLVDAMLANRIAAGEKVLNDQGDLDKLTRKELASKKSEISKASRTGLATHLAQESAKPYPVPQKKADSGQPYGLPDWMRIEEFWLEVPLGQNLDQISAVCWTILGETPVKTANKAETDQLDDATDEQLDVARRQLSQQYLDGVLRQRAFITQAYLGVRKGADPANTERLLKYVDAGIADETAAKKADESANATDSSYWRMTKFRLLVALDRPDALEKELREWIRSDVSTGPWRQSLARIVAERGKLDEAIQLFEACQKDKLLSAADFKLLADWHLILNHRAAYDQNRMASYLQMPENQLAQIIYQAQNRWGGQNIPQTSELDENTLFAFKALLQKSAQPENYFWQLRNLYAACRDFRLLQMLPDGVLGRTPNQIYSYLISIQNHVLYEVRNEATADQILVRIKSLREGELTTTDKRALDLLEAFVERKSSEVLNQPGPHVDACIAAMQRAFNRDWAEGEPLLMSSFLANLGGLPNEKMQIEQIREMQALQRMVNVGSREHLTITYDICRLRFHNYTKQAQAMQEMDLEFRTYLQAHDGIWPRADEPILGGYITMFELSNQHFAGETILQKQLAKPENQDQTNFLKERLMSLYINALEHNGAVSIGTGRVNLFKPVTDLVLKQIQSASNEQTRYQMVSRFSSALDIGFRHKIPATFEVTRQFAFEKMPTILKLQQNEYQNTATCVMHAFGEILSPELCLQYVVERMEQWPQRLEVQHNQAWTFFGGELANRRRLAGSTALDGRVLKLAITNLKQSLRDLGHGGQAIYTIGFTEFWQEKAPDFAKAAEEVLNEQRSSGRLAMSVASYLRNGLHLFPRSVEILHIANGKGLLNEGEQYTLISWLLIDNRYAETIPILETLIAAHPDNVVYRTDLMRAYFRIQRPEQLRTLTEQTNEYLHQKGRWNEGNAAQFAKGCHESDQWQRSQQLYTEVIALHQRANQSSGLNDSSLSFYYQQLAVAESRLGHTVEAVEAASAAIICWDARNDQRRHVAATLRSVLAESKNLDAYVETLDAQTAKTGQDSPILRKAVGEIYQSRQQFEKAITQFKLAIELQPNDKELFQQLMACYDTTRNPEAATNQLLRLIDLQPHDLKLYQQLADRYKNNEAEAERAATSIVESSPNEAEPHAMMAELRQNQNRWDEAIPHWEQVAKLRKLEPTGLLRLAAAQIHEKQWPAARDSVRQLQKTEWPSRFGTVEHEIQQLRNQLPRD